MEYNDELSKALWAPPESAQQGASDSNVVFGGTLPEMEDISAACKRRGQEPSSYRTTLLYAHDEIERLRDFARDVMRAWPDGEPDGGELQEIAEKHVVLIQETRTEPCGEACQCEEYHGLLAMSEGVTCYRKAAWLLTPNAQRERPERR